MKAARGISTHRASYTFIGWICAAKFKCKWNFLLVEIQVSMVRNFGKDSSKI